MNPQWTSDPRGDGPAAGSGAGRTAAALPAGRRPGLMPMVVGGLMVAAGLMAFVFYPGDPADRDVVTTGTTPPAATAPSAVPNPAAPGAPNGGITTPTRP